MSDETELMGEGELLYRATEPEMMSFREEADEAPVLEGRMMPYDEWTEVNSSIEGHFMERFAPGALAKTLVERAARIRGLFEHGMGFLDKQPILVIEDMRDEADGAYYRGSLLDGLPPLLLNGLRRGLYGSSIRFAPVKWDRSRSPKKSDHNPEGLPEHTIREARVTEFSVVTFPQYAGATAHVRSLADEYAAAALLKDPARFMEILEATTKEKTEPEHSVPNPEEDPPVQGSRSTREPKKDYLHPEKEGPAWRL